MFKSVLSMTDEELARHTEIMLRAQAYFQSPDCTAQDQYEHELEDAETESYDDCGEETDEYVSGPDDWEHADPCV